jgi:hypothetical protein
MIDDSPYQRLLADGRPLSPAQEALQLQKKRRQPPSAAPRAQNRETDESPAMRKSEKAII